MPQRFFIFLLYLAMTGSLSARQDFGDRQKIHFFEKSIRPLLDEKCITCHGPKKQESGLRLDGLHFLKKGGDSGPVIVQGKPDESLMIQAIEHSSDLQMPPEEKLTQPQIAAVRKWIREGAAWPEVGNIELVQSKWQKHWAFQKVSDPVPPVPATIDGNRPRIQNPIDQFILARMANTELMPSEPADRKTLIRRAYFGLHGLSPSSEQTLEFVDDHRPGAFAKLIDELLDSPRYGEKSARIWMDIARYADNKGYVFFEDKNYPWAWTYREWLVNAFNQDMSFDQFIVNQIAADFLTGPGSKKNLPALGFLTVGAKFVNNVNDQIDDRIDLVTRGLMGLTVSCARCHDHKFDPVPQADYYSLYGVFRSSEEPVVLPTYHPEPENSGYLTYQKGLTERLHKLNQFVENQRELISRGARNRVEEYLMAVHRRRHHPSTENFMTLTDKGSIIPKIISRYEAYLAEARNNDDPAWVIWHLYSDLDDDDFARQAEQVSVQISKIPDQKINPVVAESFTGFVPKDMNEVAQKYGQLFKRVSAKPGRIGKTGESALRGFLFGKKSPAVLPAVFGWGFLDLLPDRPTQGEYEKLLKEVENFCKTGPHAPPRAMVLLDSQEMFQPSVFLRGNPNRKGRTVPRQFLTSIPNTEMIQAVFPANQSGRLQLAKAIASRENPLTARVIVNRIWQQHFGRGLVATPSDFGLQGAKPSHPMLLDWLASWFMENGWSIKKMHKLIMLSATYQRSSDQNQSHHRDPENHFLTRFNRVRLPFEDIRDSMIAATGQLETKTGGKSFPLFQGYTPRRTVYGFINRMDLPGVLRTFDYPEPAATSGQREQTTVPAQALFFLNHAFVSQCAAKILERKEIRNAESIEEKLSQVYEVLFARHPDPLEIQAGRVYLSQKKKTKTSAWKYGFGAFDLKTKKITSFQELQHFTGIRWQGGPVLPDPRLNWVYHSNVESHPGNSMKLCSIRRWIAAENGEIEIQGLVKHEPKEGNGVNVRIIINDSRSLGTWKVHHSQHKTNIDRVSVRRGDRIDLVSDFNGNISHDQHLWMVTIRSLGVKPASHWNSKDGFQGRPADLWQSYVHALLMTNEFIFVD